MQHTAISDAMRDCASSTAFALPGKAHGMGAPAQALCLRAMQRGAQALCLRAMQRGAQALALGA